MNKISTLSVALSLLTGFAMAEDGKNEVVGIPNVGESETPETGDNAASSSEDGSLAVAEPDKPAGEVPAKRKKNRRGKGHRNAVPGHGLAEQLNQLPPGAPAQVADAPNAHEVSAASPEVATAAPDGEAASPASSESE
ncbi:MAG: hypothetical protein LBF65_00990 [Holosporales bacterium]|jgi:hypothetical protein|nr:hypothetical protein [Holosporales bacterium]